MLLGETLVQLARNRAAGAIIKYMMKENRLHTRQCRSRVEWSPSHPQSQCKSCVASHSFIKTLAQSATFCLVGRSRHPSYILPLCIAVLAVGFLKKYCLIPLPSRGPLASEGPGLQGPIVRWVYVVWRSRGVASAGETRVGRVGHYGDWRSCRGWAWLTGIYWHMFSPHRRRLGSDSDPYLETRPNP